MPFICLANANLPDGVLQITDLWPNESQRNGAIDPPGQNRYLSRPSHDIASVNLVTGVVQGDPQVANKTTLSGLGAYLVDRVEPGGLAPATAEVTLTGVQAGDQIEVKGFVFEFAAGANDLVHAGSVADPYIVGLGADDDAAAANLTAALNDAGVQGAMDAVALLNVHAVATNPGAPSAVVNMTVEDNLAAAVLGPDGDISFAVSNAARIVPTGDEDTFGRFVRTPEAWDEATLAAAVAAIQGRVDAGSGLTSSDLNTYMNNVLVTDFEGTLSNSTGVLTELLSILAGRVYEIPMTSPKFTAVTAPDQVHVWSATQYGSFTTASTVFDSMMQHGEWGSTAQKWRKTGGRPGGNKPTFVGGDTVNNEIGGVRTTVDSTHFASSLATGQLARYSAGITLFPDAEVQAFVSDWTRRTHRQATIDNQRVVTVYDDDGSVLA